MSVKVSVEDEGERQVIRLVGPDGKNIEVASREASGLRWLILGDEPQHYSFHVKVPTPHGEIIYDKQTGEVLVWTVKDDQGRDRPRIIEGDLVNRL